MNVPSAVLKRKVSPSRRKTSQTRQAASSGMALAKAVYSHSTRYSSGATASASAPRLWRSRVVYAFHRRWG